MKQLIEKYKPAFKEYGKNFLYGFGAILGTVIVLSIIWTLFPRSFYYVQSLIEGVRLGLLLTGVFGVGKLLRKGLGE